MAIQDQVIATKNYLKFVIKANIPDDKCRRCQQTSETIQHITSGCQAISATDYSLRHDNVAKIVHQSLAQQHNLVQGRLPYYQYNPSAVLENKTHRLYWDRTVITDRTISANRPDIVITDKSDRVTYLIDIAVPNSHNIQQTYTGKINKYLPLAEEVRQMWKQERVLILPLILSATGVIPRSLKANLVKLGIHHSVMTIMQKAALLGTCSVVRSFMNLPI